MKNAKRERERGQGREEMSKNEHRVRSFQSFRKDEIVESNPG
jgi:hypothetical protein